MNQKVAQRILEKLGCAVRVVPNGALAVEELERGDYDLVFMDCQMPVLDGYAATGEIRRREAGGRHVPIVAMTAHAMVGDRAACLNAGMDDYVAKPVRVDDLDRVLSRWLGQPAESAHGEVA